MESPEGATTRLLVLRLSCADHRSAQERQLDATATEEVPPTPGYIWDPWTPQEAGEFLRANFDQRQLSTILRNLEAGEQVRAAYRCERVVIEGDPVPDGHNLRTLLTDRRLLIVDLTALVTGAGPSEPASIYSIRLDDIAKMRGVHRDRQTRTTMLTTVSGGKWKLKWPPPPQSHSDKKFLMLLPREVFRRDRMRRRQGAQSPDSTP